MRIERLTAEKGDALAVTLVNSRVLDGRYFVIPRKDDAKRFMLVQGESGEGNYTAMTGYDPRRRQWITLSIGDADAVVLLGGITAPFV